MNTKFKSSIHLLHKPDLSGCERDAISSALANGYFACIAVFLSAVTGSVVPLAAMAPVYLFVGRVSIYRRVEGGAS